MSTDYCDVSLGIPVKAIIKHTLFIVFLIVGNL